MVIELTPEQVARVLAATHGSSESLDVIVAQTVAFIASHADLDGSRLKRSIEQADRGEFIEEEEMDARVEAMLRRP